MSSCISLHIVEALGLHQDSTTGTIPLSHGNTSPLPTGLGLARHVEIQRRTFWVSKLLNTWISFEYGRSRIILHGEYCPLLIVEDGRYDHTSTMVSLFQLSEDLDPTKDIPATVLEDTLKQLDSFNFEGNALTLSQSVLAFTIYRWLRLLGLSSNRTVIERVISIGRRGLEASHRCVDANHPWWHVNNVPFQFTCILLSIDTPDSLAQVRDSLTLLKRTACHFGTAKSHQAFETIDMLVRLSLSRKERGASLLKESILASEYTIPETQQQRQQILAQDAAVHNSDGPLLFQLENTNDLTKSPDLSSTADWDVFIRDLDFSAALF